MEVGAAVRLNYFDDLIASMTLAILLRIDEEKRTFLRLFHSSTFPFVVRGK